MRLIKLFILLFVSFSVTAQVPDKKLDDLINNTLKTFDVPGISVGVIKDGQVIYAKGHGVRSLQNKKKMNENTLVGVASNSKGFTCFALALLVDEGKLDWDDRVRKYIPEFTMSDPWVSEHFTVRDLVTHRSGMPLGAGDLMFFPDGNDFTVDDVLAGVRHIEPESSFRSTFRYNNNMFIIAGEVIKRVSGLSWEAFVEKRILQPVGMKSSKASYNRVNDKSNIIDAHTLADGKVIMIPHDWSDTANPAGGIMSNVTDMLTWAKFLIDGGVTKDDKRIISKEQMHELWSLQTPIPVRANDPYDTHFKGYSLGWFVSDVKGGYKQVTHTGGLLGTVTQFTLIPELGLGIVVLTNQMSGAAFYTITNTIKDSYLGYKDRQWLDYYGKRSEQWYMMNDSIKTDVYNQVDVQKSTTCSTATTIVGTYTDAWFGDVIISKDLKIKCVRSPRLSGQLYPYNTTTYVAKWKDRSYDADAFVTFAFDAKGNATGATIKAIAPITDFSFDFHDLNLKRKK